LLPAFYVCPSRTAQKISICEPGYWTLLSDAIAGTGFFHNIKKCLNGKKNHGKTGQV
jgi:hypothetical protein